MRLFLFVCLVFFSTTLFSREVLLTEEGLMSRLSLELGETLQYQVKAEDKVSYIDVDISNIPTAYIPSIVGKSTSLVDRMVLLPQNDTKSILRIYLKTDKDAVYDFVDFRLNNPNRFVLDIWKKSKESKPVLIKHLPSSFVKISKKIKFDSEYKPLFKRHDNLKIELEDVYEQPKLQTNFKRIDDPTDPRFARYTFDRKVINIINELASKSDIYLHYPILRNEISLDVPPLEYDKAKGETKEDTHYNVILKFFENKKYGIALKSIEFFKEEFSESKYLQNLAFLEGDVYSLIAEELDSKFYQEEAIGRYKVALGKYPKALSCARAFMILGKIYMQKGFYYGALEVLETALRRYRDNPYKWMMRLARADTLLRLGSYSKSFKKFKKIYKDAVRTFNQDKSRTDVLNFAAEAAFRLGNVYFEQRHYSSAIAMYNQAFSVFPDQSYREAFPNALFNLAESYFWLDNYEDSLNMYREFLIYFHNHPYSSFAMNRIGENLSLLGAPFKQVKSAYLETSFRYPESFGSMLSKVRLAANNVIIAKSKDLRQFVKIIDEGILNKDYQDLDVFSVILKGESVVKRGIRLSDSETITKGITVWKDYLRKHPLTLYYPKLKEKIIYGISELLENYSMHENYYDVVKTYESNIGMSIQEDNPKELALIVAEAYYALSLDTKAYDKVLLYEDKKGDKHNRLYLLLKAITAINNKDIKEASQYLKLLEDKGFDKDRNIDTYARFKERHKYKFYVTKSELFKLKGDIKAQVTMLEKAIQSYIGKDPAVTDRRKLELGLLYQKIKKDDQALRVYTEVCERDKTTVMAEEAFYYIGHIKYSLNKLIDAVSSYKEAIKLFPDNKEAGLAHYRVGKALLELGKIDEAKIVFNDIVSKTVESTWTKMAQDELDNFKWKTKSDKVK